MIDENLKKILDLPNEAIGIMIKLLLTTRMEDFKKLNKELTRQNNLKQVANIINHLGD